MVFTFSTEEQAEQHGLSGVFQTIKNKVAGLDSPTNAAKNSDENRPEPAAGANQPQIDEQAKAEKFERFKAFIQTEAKTLDNPKVNTEAKQTTLIERASQLDDVEKYYLKTATLDTNQPINERILSVYLLSLSTGSTAQSLVNEIAQTPLPDHGPSAPHSEAEIRNSQELALRYMAIDKLVQNYKSNPPDSLEATIAMQDLKGHSTQNPIPQVRKYANDELSKINRSN